jgi:hypothetical protein
MNSGISVGIIKQGTGGTSDHNELENLQGGKPAEFFHFEENQHAEILALIYKNSINTLTILPTSGERGVVTPLEITYNLLTRDDVFTAASIDNGVGNILPYINDGNRIVAVGSSVVSKTVAMALSYTRKGVASNENKTAVYTAHIPQFAGVSNEPDYGTGNYATIVADFQKFLQSSATLQKQSSPEDQYIWFISNKNNAQVLDQNNFNQSVGVWDDGVSEFYLKSLVLTLADGDTTARVYLYRSRNVKTLTNFTYKIQ